MEQNNLSIPTYEEFMAYAEKEGWTEWSEEVWKELERTHWLTNKGTACSNWHIIANARNGVVMRRLGIQKNKNQKIENIAINQVSEEFPGSNMHYVCYTDGYCNELNEEHIGGAAYVILKDGKVVKKESKGFLNTKNYRMEMLAIISAIKSCPKGAYVDVYTDSTFTIKILSKSYAPNKNADLYHLFNVYKVNLADLRFHWIDKTDNNQHVKLVHDLSVEAYEAI